MSDYNVTRTSEESAQDAEKKEEATTAKELFSDFTGENSDDSADIEVVVIKSENKDVKAPNTRKAKREIPPCEGNDEICTPKRKKYVQKYVKDWEKIPAFKQWLTESFLGNTYFYCKFCKSDNKCGKTELEKHMVSKKHVRNAKETTVKVQRKFSFRGLLCPVFTPFSLKPAPMAFGAHAIDYTVISSYAKYLYSCGVKGVLINDVIGEGMSLTSCERMKITEEWAKECDKYGMTIMVQIGGGPLKQVQELAAHAEKKKVDAIVLLPDAYNKPDNHLELMRYIKAVSSTANSVPVLYHHYPSYSGCEFDMAQFLNDIIGEIDQFVGIIYSSNDLKEASAALNVNLDKFTVFMGTDEFILGSAALGFSSIMSVSLNFATKVVQSIRGAIFEGNINSARIGQKCLSDTVDAILGQGNRIPALKCGMNLLTNIKLGPVREPMVSLWDDKVRKMKTDLQQLGVL